MRIGSVSTFQKNPFLNQTAGRGSWPAQETEGQKASVSEEFREKKRMLSQSSAPNNGTENGKKIFQAASQQSLVSSMQTYTDSLRASREKTKNSSLAVKHVRYQSKAISSQIVRSKTSVSARQAVGKARREVIRLKRLRQNEDYDEEELQAAIVHAQSMERVAKKKLHHLQQEELIHVTEEDEETGSQDHTLEEDADLMREERYEEEEAFSGEAIEEGYDPESMEELLTNMEGTLEEWSVQMESGLGDLSEEFLQELQAQFQDLLENMGLSELEELTGEGRREMPPEDFKELQRKHRQAEMKEIVKADSDYLKAVFERFEKLRSASAGGAMPGGSGNISMGSGVGNAVFTPGLSMGAADVGAGVDISI